MITHQSTRKRNIHFYGLLRYFKPFYNYHSNIYTNIYIFPTIFKLFKLSLESWHDFYCGVLFLMMKPLGGAHLGEWGKVRPGSIVWIQNQRRCGFLKRCRCFIYKLIRSQKNTFQNIQLQYCFFSYDTTVKKNSERWSGVKRTRRAD